MHLKMMSLGRSWDPDRGKYLEHRPVDGAKAPIFPSDFHPLVERAIKDSRALIEINCKSTAAEDILPPLSPNICVVNFYSESGRLGLHQVCSVNFLVLVAVFSYTFYVALCIVLY
jgi:hypothetical protein